jgi:hypothetical protein
MTAAISRLKDSISKCTCIGSIGGNISTDSLTINLNSDGSRMKLRGKLVFFEFREENSTVYTIAQVSQIQGINPVLDEHPVRTILKKENSIDSISGELDVNIALIKPKASYMLLPSHNQYDSNGIHNTLMQTVLGSVPPTDTLVYVIDEIFLNSLFSKYQNRFFYIGNAYLSNVKIPLMFRHFGTGEFGMANDAYHLLVTAKTGGGKSTVSKMISICYARYPEMAQFIIDPVGEFANNARGNYGTEKFRLNLKQIYNRLGKEVRVYNVRDLVLDTWELFESVLYRVEFLKKLSIDAGQNRKKGCKVLREELENSVNLTKLWTEQSFKNVMNLLHDEDIQKQIFKGKEQRERLEHFVDKLDNNDTYIRFWQPFTSLFREDREEGKINISSLTNQVFDLNNSNRPVIVIDLSSRQEDALEWDDDIEKLVVKRLFQKIYIDARGFYQKENSLNCLVMLDEAHRFANREVDSSGSERSEIGDKKSIVALLKQYVRETRKFGIGWMFVTTSLADMDESIVNQTGVRVFGYGLNMGNELERLKQCVTDQSDVDFYLAFPHPLNALEEEFRRYSFMITGPCSPFSDTSSPIFLTAFNSPDEFKGANGLL